MKAVSEMSSRWWYRLLKVVFYLLLVTSIVFSLFYLQNEYIPYEVTDREVSTFSCLSGNFSTYTFTSVNLRGDRLTAEEVLRLCEVTDAPEPPIFDQSNTHVENVAEIRKWQGEILSLVDYSMETKVIGSWYETVFFLLIIILFWIIVFESVRRLFYYIVLGSIRPIK